MAVQFHSETTSSGSVNDQNKHAMFAATLPVVWPFNVPAMMMEVEKNDPFKTR